MSPALAAVMAEALRRGFAVEVTDFEGRPCIDVRTKRPLVPGWSASFYSDDTCVIHLLAHGPARLMGAALDASSMCQALLDAGRVAAMRVAA